ncbi:mechanosensitive ion channel domain-containing protein [Imhoffiella purpurea]|uniref:Mechanosensitive ion channel family protein n=1 Tax=Imhoffiella purpurea TaxID=1249627 RepID=W9W1M3_9GAMM|nr:mechanosensitive ion channel domain-containing protein [Imhoffiella purpurea]EXJ16510.1 mechanosensitive ion channel family protein [Imhoffiella purpurea]
MISARLTRLSFLALALICFSISALAQDTPAAAEDAPVTDSPATPAPEPKNGLDPALVGLAALPGDDASAEDYNKTLKIIEDRIAAVEREGAPPAPGGPDEGTVPDPRLEPLLDLRLSLQRRATLLARRQELQGSLNDIETAQETLQREGLTEKPPYPIDQIDQLHSEHRLARHAAEAAERALQIAQQQTDMAAKEIETKEQERRLARTQLEQAAPGDDRLALERRLEAARLGELAARQRQATAKDFLELTHLESQVARQRSDLLSAKIARMKDAVSFTKTMLDDRIEELTAREAQIRKRIEALTQAGDRAESALFDARRRLERNRDESRTRLLEEEVAAREAELGASRKGIAYLRHALSSIASARTLWQRRYRLYQGDQEAPLTSWLQEVGALADTIADETRYLQDELATVRSVQLMLVQRLADSGLASDMRTALKRRLDALDAQEGQAEDLLGVEDQLSALADRFEQELDPLVSRRSFAQRMDEAATWFAGWWNKELFVFQDQGFYLRDMISGGAVFLLVIAAVSLLQRLLRRAVLPRLVAASNGEKRAPRALVLALVRNTSQLFVVIIAFYAAMRVSGLLPERLHDWLWSILVVVFWLQIGIWASAGALDYLNRQRSRRERQDPSAVSGYGLILFFIRVGIWSIVLISVLTHFDYPITGLIGALGVGGIAVAFAVQNILADIFSSMAIILDKPFRVGDFVVTGSTLGVVEQIGVKTTRIRSLSGEQVTMSNTDLLNSRIHNYKRMEERRVVFKLGVVYQTPPDLLERIPGMIERIIRDQAHTRFDRAHFFEYGDFALLFEIVYYVQGPDYNRYMDIQQAINLAINRRFREEGIEFAYPTQELILRHAPPQSGSADARSD